MKLIVQAVVTLLPFCLPARADYLPGAAAPKIPAVDMVATHGEIPLR